MIASSLVVGGSPSLARVTTRDAARASAAASTVMVEEKAYCDDMRSDRSAFASRSLFLLRTHAANPSSTPDEVAVVVPEAESLDVAEARAVPADAATRDAP